MRNRCQRLLAPVLFLESGEERGQAPFLTLSLLELTWRID